ncbi:hypothetical protein HYFRA_00008384 [Hymenoscyphus fraxineus]|uniref:Uncharacterized protein n=1 Tax=Hymenoscyphus fraxineus TaxID=746836 RepID=A0A9N9PFB2_9HELO|nr:hypothetical protein HYFRA_00008384 [Hymenoscyphus fraxineus]
MKSLIPFYILNFSAVAIAASGPVYITEIPAYATLAPCAASGVSYAVQGLTGSKCPTDPAQLQSCACTKDSNSAAVGSSIGKEVLAYCSSTASDDVTSAASVFSIYCNPGGSVAPTNQPASGGVSQFVTDLPAFTNLAPCAGSAISYAMASLTYKDCPSEAAGLQSCACTKNQNSARITQALNSQVGSYCGSTRTEDKTSAQAFFAGYCGLAGGSASAAFPTPSYLPGVVSYYLTDLPQYGSLAPCAASAMRYEISSIAANLCPPSPMALVSCACVKDNNSAALTAAFMSEVKSYCGNTASADIQSALGVFDFYCSAGKGLVTPQGVTASVAPTPTNGDKPATGTKETGTSGAKSTSTTTSTSNTNTTAPSPTAKRPLPIAAIIGGAIGLIALIVAGLLALFCYRKNRTKKSASKTQNNTPYDYTKAELPVNERTSVTNSVSPVLSKPSPMGMNIDHRPVSPMEEKPYAHNNTYRSELQHTGSIRAEMPTGGVQLQELPPNQQYGYTPVNRYPSPNSPFHPSPLPSPGLSPNGNYYEVAGQNVYSQPQGQGQYSFPLAGQGGQVVHEMGDGRSRG